jgi:hypothetical protein
MYENTLHIVTPSKSNVNGKFMKCINGILFSEIRDTIRMNITFELYLGKSNIVHARSIVLTKWYDAAKDGDMFLFIDSDQTFTERDIINIVNLEKCDVACGIYCNSSGQPNVFMNNLSAFLNNSSDNRVLYAGTGFMLIRHHICKKLVNFIEKLDGGSRFVVDADISEDVIPFFRTRFVDSENGIQPKDKKHWLGEDYSFCWMVRQCGGVIRGFISSTLGHEILQVRTFVPDNYVGYTWPKDSVVYVCGMGIVKFNPNERHHTGSEKAVIQLCKRWASTKKVTVFGNVEKGVYDGVEYRPMNEFDITDHFDTVILWRSFGCRYIPSIKAKKIIIDLHDCHTYHTDIIRVKADKVFMKSLFHRSLNISIPDNKTCIIPNGIEDDILECTTTGKRDPKRFIYASCYTRGLENILVYCWPHIRKCIPDAELHCFYGMDLCEHSIRMKFEKLFKETEGVYDHGRVTIDEIIKEKQKASFHIYLTDDKSEIDCITVRESAILGCIPLLTRENVFSERIGMFYDIDRSDEEGGYKSIADKIVKTVKDEEGTAIFRKEMQEHALRTEPSWDDIASEWIKLIS